MTREQTLRRRVRVFTGLFILGLVLSGATALPINSEVDYLVKISHARVLTASNGAPATWASWLIRVQKALHQVRQDSPFLFYGTDWLAFGHFVIALAFAGAWRDPVRNRWLFDFGILACILVVPYAFAFGSIRGIPLWWRLLDCSFAAFGFIPLWLCRRWSRQLEVDSASQGL